MKIDKSFVLPMGSDPHAEAIVKAVVDVAHNLGLAVVAEGVEDRRTLTHLQRLGCAYVQGYYLSRPIAAVGITEWLTAERAGRQQAMGTRRLRAAN